ncbi:MAG: toll/interleukin-1 receptor domain-containing protein [Pseudomonadota bacterium]|nr:toll/interleukin-1 receptor domain-containing protein [Pseudomonadota bacterium]
MDRDLVLVVFDLVQSGSLAIRCTMPFAAGVGGKPHSLLDCVNISLRSHDAVTQTPRTGSPPPETLRSALPLLADDDVRIYSWRRARLKSNLMAASAPAPGVVICLVRPVDHAGSWPPIGVDLEMASSIARGVVDLNPNGQFAQVHDFLRSADAHAQPIRQRRSDVFLSHATADAALAREISETLTGHGLKVFLAEMTIRPGASWSEEIRVALAEARAALVLLTPNSVKSQWVMAELGALWALRVPFVPATVYVDHTQLPEFVSGRQCVEVLTAEGRALCISELTRMCAECDG